jgi:hypothetical protein
VRSRPRSMPRRLWRDLRLAFLVSLTCWSCTTRNPAFEATPGPIAPDAGLEISDAAAALPPDLRPVAPDQTSVLDAAAPEDTATPVTPDLPVVLPPDAAPDLPADRGPPGTALLVVGETTLAPGDKQLKASLMRLGFAVVARDGQAAVTSDALGRSLVVISGSAWSDDVGAKFRDVPVPVVVFDCAVFGPMKLTGTKEGTDFDSVDDQRLMIVDDTHPLAGGLSGLVTVASAQLQISWGLPSSSAVKVATVVNQPNHFTIFGYTEGSAMVGMTAPARRVGAFVRFPDQTSYAESGLLLFEAAALWSIGHLE